MSRADDLRAALACRPAAAVPRWELEFHAFVAASGPRLDLGASAERRAAVRSELVRDFEINMRFWDSPKPTVAAVHGYCLGSGMEMAMACDVTLAAEGCRFGAPEVRFGSGIVAMLLPWLAGPKRARELLLTGNDRISAAQAEAWGIVNRVVAPERLRDETRELALEIAHNDPLAVRLTKQAINRSLDSAGLRKALTEALEIDVEIESTVTPESRTFNEILRREGAKAAVEWRRQAGWPRNGCGNENLAKNVFHVSLEIIHG